MSCQLGIYRDREHRIDEQEALIYQHGDGSPRDTLRLLAPFLRAFQATRNMADTGHLTARLTWYLIDSGRDPGRGSGFPDVEISREIRGDIDFFCKISPGYVDVFRVNEILEWKPIATLEIPTSPVALDVFQD